MKNEKDYSLDVALSACSSALFALSSNYSIEAHAGYGYDNFRFEPNTDVEKASITE